MTLTLVKDLQTELQHFEKLLTEKEKAIKKEKPEKRDEKSKELKQPTETGTVSYCNGSKFSDRQVWAKRSGSTLCIFRAHYSNVKRLCSNFRIIAAIFLGV